MIRTAATYIGFIFTSALAVTSAAKLVQELVADPSPYTDNVAIFGFFAGLFGAAAAILAKHAFRQP